MIGGKVNRSLAQEVENSSPFIVKNIHIDVTAKSAKEARDKAFRQAQEKSLPLLIQQLKENKYDVSLMRQADPKSIANAVKDFEISNEQISAVRYKGDFVFRYDENLLSHYFYGAQTQEITTPSSPHHQIINTTGQERILVLPFFQSGGGKMSLWEGYNPWKDVWTRTTTSSIIAPIGDLSDLRDIQGNQALTYNPEQLARMSARYSADRVVILIASHENAALPSSLSQRATGMLRVSAYDTARGRPEFVNDIMLKESNYQNFGKVLQAGYNRSVELIHGLNSVRSIGYASTPVQEGLYEPYTREEKNTESSTFQARIEYTSMQDWVKAQKVLRSIPSISALNVLSLTSREAELKIHYKGTLENVASAMTQKGYNIQATSKAGRYLIYTGRQSAYNQNGGIVYR